MECIDKYLVTVKVGVPGENGKVKNHKESFLVTNVASPQKAADIIEKEFADYNNEWQIECVRAQKIEAVYDAMTRN